MDLDAVTVQDCIDMYDLKGYETVINDGRVSGFRSETVRCLDIGRNPADGNRQRKMKGGARMKNCNFLYQRLVRRLKRRKSDMGKRGMCFTLLLTIFISGYLFASLPVSAAGAGYADNNLDSGINTVSSSWQKAIVLGDGARLRAEPNTESTIYGLMYPYEEIEINLGQSTGEFYYARRSNGVYGYVHRGLVLPVDSGVIVSED